MNTDWKSVNFVRFFQIIGDFLHIKVGLLINYLIGRYLIFLLLFGFGSFGSLFSDYFIFTSFLLNILELFIIVKYGSWDSKMSTFIVLNDGLNSGVFLGRHSFRAGDTSGAIKGGFEGGLLLFFELYLFLSLFIWLFFKGIFCFLGKNLIVFIIWGGSTALGAHAIVNMVV